MENKTGVSPQQTEESRAEFEKWAREALGSPALIPSDDGTGYKFRHTQNYWTCWQAAQTEFAAKEKLR